MREPLLGGIVAAAPAPGVTWEGWEAAVAWGQPCSLLTTPVLELGLVLHRVPCGNCLPGDGQCKASLRETMGELP